MSQLRTPSGLCFLESGCLSSPSPFPGLLCAEPWHDAGFRAPRLRQGSGRGQAGLAQGSAQPPASPSHMDTHPVPFLSAARRGAVPASLSEPGAARAWGSAMRIIPSASRRLCIPASVPTGPRHRPWVLVPRCSLLGRAAWQLGCPVPLALGHGVAGGCAWQSVHKAGKDFAPGCPVSKLLMVIPVCYLLPAATGDGFPLFLQAGGDCHLTRGSGLWEVDRIQP